MPCPVGGQRREAGQGYADILVETDDDEPLSIAIEVKYARDGNLDADRFYGMAFINLDGTL